MNNMVLGNLLTFRCLALADKAVTRCMVKASASCCATTSASSLQGLQLVVLIRLQDIV